MPMIRATAIAALLLGGLSACSTTPPPAPPPTPAAQWCREALSELDQMIDVLGLRYAENRRIEGFPYLRVDRPLQGMRTRLHSRAAFDRWVAELARQDRLARDAELNQLALRVPQLPAAGELIARADLCRQVLIEQELAQPALQARLLAASEVPDDYSTAARVLGLYPVTELGLKLGIDAWHRQTLARFAAPLPAGGGLLYLPPAAMEPAPTALFAQWIAEATDNALGIPQLSAAQWARMALHHAPVLWIDARSRDDRIGTLYWHPDAPGIGVDTGRPAVYYRTGFTAFGRSILPQITYLAWFPARPAEGPLDPYAGRLDGLIWRVTIGPDGQVLAYDSIHPCGCFYMFFLPRPLALRPADPGTEPVLLPQREVPQSPVALRVASGDHMLTRVLPAGAAPAAAAADRTVVYSLRDWQDLNLMPDGKGGITDLYDEAGLVPGTERAERFYLWPSGVVSPGQMRAWGRHAIAFVGRRHFDDPDLLCSVIDCAAARR